MRRKQWKRASGGGVEVSFYTEMHYAQSCFQVMCAQWEHSHQGNSGFWIFESLFLALRNKHRCGCFPPTFTQYPCKNISTKRKGNKSSDDFTYHCQGGGSDPCHDYFGGFGLQCAYQIIDVANYPSLTVRGLVKRICKGKYKQTKISFRQTRTQANNDMTDCLTELSRVYSYQKALDL